MDGGLNNVYDAIYGGPALTLVETPASAASTYSGWSPDSWDLAGFNLGDLGNDPAAVVDLSDDSLSSGEEVAPSELSLSVGSMEYPNSLLASTCTSGDGFVLEGNYSLKYERR
jgi:hypothetical protein